MLRNHLQPMFFCMPSQWLNYLRGLRLGLELTIFWASLDSLLSPLLYKVNFKMSTFKINESQKIVWNILRFVLCIFFHKDLYLKKTEFIPPKLKFRIWIFLFISKCHPKLILFMNFIEQKLGLSPTFEMPHLSMSFLETINILETRWFSFQLETTSNDESFK